MYLDERLRSETAPEATPVNSIRSRSWALLLVASLGLALVGSSCEPEETVPSSCLAEASICPDVALELPGPRGEVVGVWDGARRRMVLFGGDQGPPVDCIPSPDFVGETWEFRTECDAFVPIETSQAPSARGRHVAALDEGDGRMIVHGGRWRETGTSGDYTMREDTWAFDLGTDTWSLLSEDGGPGGRANHVGVVADGRFIVHGGDSSPSPLSYVPSDEVWALDLSSGSWTQLEVQEGPPARLFHAGVASADGRYLYVYGGTSSDPFFSPAFSDLWQLDLESLEWDQLHDGEGTAPDSPFWANLVADPTQARLLLWAGHDDTALGNTNQLWAFDLGSGEWSRLQEGDVYANPANDFCDFPADFTEPDLASPERRNAGAAAITSCGELLVFGGKTDCGLINDLWAWDPASGWAERSSATAGQICPRDYGDCETMCF